MMLLKLLTVIVALYALRRVILRYRKRGTVTLEFISWFIVWAGIGVVVFIPGTTDRLAHVLGVSTGFNALAFFAIVGLLLAVYRLVQRVQMLERDVTQIVRTHALEHPARASESPPRP
jgi:hypothetical protein